MNKLQLNRKLAEQAGISLPQARKTVDLFFNSITDLLCSEGRVEIRGLCSFKTKTYKSYTGRNPTTGNVLIVKSKKLPIFKPGTQLRKRVDRYSNLADTEPGA